MNGSRRSRVQPWLLLPALLGPAAIAQHHEGHDPRALAEDPRLAQGQIAPVLAGLGEHHHRVTTSVERAQLFFDQGLKLTYGFNHQEALRSFKEAARLDPDCAMAYWGWALVLGPNINLPMRSEVAGQAHEAIRMAVAKREKVSAAERAYIDALAKRYTGEPGEDRARLDRAYADAMRELHRAYPEDTDAATLYVSALMELTPWDYWYRDGSPKENTEEMIAVLEQVIRRDPHHEGALHFMIHMVEAVDPKRGVAAADALSGLAPGAGHLVHMPSHIYLQVGRYAESYDANVNASAVDESYISQCRAQGIYPLNYYPHNLHFTAWAALMQGRSAEALTAARKVASRVPADMHGNDWALYETFLAMPLATMVRFGKWSEILAESQPPTETVYWTGIWRYARGMAYAHTSRLDEAVAERGALQAIVESGEAKAVPVGYAKADALLRIAAEILGGEITAKAGRTTEALALLERAVRLEDGLTYNEPPDWPYPVRHALGAVLLEAGRPDEAAVVYWRDLSKHRENGFALFGLWQSLAAQGNTTDAAAIEARFRKAWALADVTLGSSRF